MQHVAILKSRSGKHGGLEKYASRIAAAFAQRGAQVSVLTTGSCDPLHEQKISFFPFKTSPWPSFVRMEQFDRYVEQWLKNNPADLIFGMDRNRHQTHIRAGNGVHAAYLESRIFTEGRWKYWTCKLNPMHRKILELEKAAFENRRLQKLFTNSHLVKRQILERYTTDPSKIEVIHNGVEWHEMQTDFLNWERRRKEGILKYGFDPDRFHFLFIGNGYLRKGLDRLLEGLSKLTRTDFQLTVIGKDNQMEQYKAKSIQLGLKDRVRFFGKQDEIRLFYQMADVLVIPSFYDPFANVTIEALAMGLFVVSSKQNGGAEILTEKNGIVIENLLDPDAMLHALQEALKHPKTPLRATAARTSVEHLDFSKQMGALMSACGMALP